MMNTLPTVNVLTVLNNVTITATLSSLAWASYVLVNGAGMLS
jgi:hypothetical protein